jgi:hypothetical protein
MEVSGDSSVVISRLHTSLFWDSMRASSHTKFHLSGSACLNDAMASSWYAGFIFLSRSNGPSAIESDVLPQPLIPSMVNVFRCNGTLLNIFSQSTPAARFSTAVTLHTLNDCFGCICTDLFATADSGSNMLKTEAIRVLYLDTETDATFEDLGFQSPPAESIWAWNPSEKKSAWRGGCERMNVTVAVSELDGVLTIHLREEPTDEQRAMLGNANLCVHPYYHKLVNLMHDCDQIVAYNGEFDIRCMMKYMRGAAPHVAPKAIFDTQMQKLYDPMLSISVHEDARYRKLDSALEFVLGKNISKTADGCSAVQFFWAGRIPELALYCADDVRLVRRLDVGLTDKGIRRLVWQDAKDQAAAAWEKKK